MYLKILLDTVGANRLIGEDLGVVPDYVRPNLVSLGIAGFKIPIWEKENDGQLIDGKSYQRLSLSTYATHDHPPLKAYWEGLNSAAGIGNGHALYEMQCLANFAGIREKMPLPFSDEIHMTLVAALFRVNSWIAILMITDLFGSDRRFNIPGEFAESNWSERLPEPVAKWKDNPRIVAIIERIRPLLKETGRHAGNFE